VPSILDDIGDFAVGFTGQRPVYNGDLKIGHWQNNATGLCRGQITLEVSAAQAGSPDQWTTKDDFWQDIPVTAFCVASGITPPWATAAQIDQAHADAGAGAAIISGPVASLTSALDSAGGAAKWGVIAGVALGAVALVALARR
jgi:hypothetical protein